MPCRVLSPIHRHLPRRRAALLATALVLPLTACGGSSGDASSSAAGAGAACPAKGLTFGVEPFESPSKLEPAYRALAEALSKKLDCSVKVQIVDNYSAEVLAMRNDRLDLGQFGPLGFVFASEKAGAEPLASFGTKDGKLSSYTAGIWVKKDSPIRSVKDLEGRSLALGSNGSTSGDALPRLALMKSADRPTCVMNGPPTRPGCPPLDGCGISIGVSGSQTLPLMPRGLGQNTAGPV